MRYLLIIFIFLLMIPPHVSAELIRKVEKDNKSKTILFLSDGEEIARETVAPGKQKTVSGEILDGIYKEYSKNGTIKYEWLYKSGHLDGVSRELYDGRRPKYEWSYKNGTLDGPSRYYSSFGHVVRERMYLLGAQDGLTREYYLNGKLKTETMYHENEKDGLQIEYYKNGKVKYEKTYKDDDLVSTKLFDEEGEPITILNL
ncbi:hypothetical protein IID04_02530 [PVC group bacterium]|nr:hypothetical protein [PVC group bacterium]